MVYMQILKSIQLYFAYHYIGHLSYLIHLERQSILKGIFFIFSYNINFNKLMYNVKNNIQI